MAAAGKWKLYEAANLRLADGTFDMDNASLGLTMALFLSTSNCNTLSVGTGVYGDLTNQHANGNGYTTGGQALTGETWTKSGSVATFDCDNVVWTASGGSIVARFAVIYCNATVNSNREAAALCLPVGYNPGQRHGDRWEHLDDRHQRQRCVHADGRDVRLSADLKASRPATSTRSRSRIP
jgi:hypothetical protein